ncbi:MAG: class I SAM-dependent methyltransferase [Pseudomonadota bacterium]
MRGNRHHEQRVPSPWIVRFAPEVPRGARVLDLACGGGRHSHLFLKRDCRVLAVDRDISGMGYLAHWPTLQTLQMDLETGEPFPPRGARFDAVVVVNYLYRPLLSNLVAAVAPGGALIYETFAQGNEAFGKPSNPDYLLRPGELLDAVWGALKIVAYEDLVVEKPARAAVQRIYARRESS